MQDRIGDPILTLGVGQRLALLGHATTLRDFKECRPLQKL